MASTGFNPAVYSAKTNAAQFSKKLANAQQQLSSGMRTINPATDPASSAVGSTLKSNAVVFQQLIRNTNNALSVLNYAQTAIGNVSDLLTQMKGMAAQALDPTLADQRGNIQKAFEVLQGQINNIGTNTAYMGTKLLDGSFTGDFQIGLAKENTMTIAITEDMRALSSCVVSIVLTDSAAPAVPGSNAKAAYEAIDTDLATIGGLVATIASKQTQLQAVAEQLTSQLSAESQAMDTTIGADINDTINDTTTFSTQLKIAQSMLQSSLQQLKDLGDLVQQASR